MRTILLSALLLLVPLAGAQSPLAVDVNTIWNHYTNQPACCTTFGSTEKDDPRFSGGGNFGTGGSTASGSFTWSWPLDPALDRVVHLDPEGKIESTVHIGGSYSTSPYLGSGKVSVTMRLMLGDETVATGPAVDVTYVTAQAYQPASWSVSPQLTTLDPANGNLVWSVTVSGAYSGVFLSHTDAQGNGWLTLPITGTVEPVVASEVVRATLNETQFELRFDNATSATHAYNLTSTLDAGMVSVVLNGTGNATMQLRDASNATIVDQVLTNGTHSFPFTEAVAGNWSLQVAFAQFNGTFAWSLGGPPTPDEAVDPTVEDPGPVDNATAPAPNKDSPMPGIIPAVVVAWAFLRRRR